MKYEEAQAQVNEELPSLRAPHGFYDYKDGKITGLEAYMKRRIDRAARFRELIK